MKPDFHQLKVASNQTFELIECLSACLDVLYLAFVKYHVIKKGEMLVKL